MKLHELFDAQEITNSLGSFEENFISGEQPATAEEAERIRAKMDARNKNMAKAKARAKARAYA